MLAALLSAILPALADSVVKAMFGLLTAEMNRRNLIAQGEAIQAAKETAVSEVTEARIAQAEVQAPQTPQGVEERIKDGSF